MKFATKLNYKRKFFLFIFWSMFSICSIKVLLLLINNFLVFYVSAIHRYLKSYQVWLKCWKFRSDLIKYEIRDVVTSLKIYIYIRVK